MGGKSISLVAVLSLLLSMTNVGLAQQAPGTIAGTIQDTSGAVIPGVSITLSSPGIIGGNQTAVTSEGGTYRFTRLVPGTYSVRAELTGFRSAERGGINVNADVTVRTDLTLEVGNLSDAVTVTGETPLLDTTTALTQAVLDRKTLDQLPTGNDLWSIGRMVPGVLLSKYDVGGSESYQQSTATIHGSSGAEQKYSVDGMDTAWAGGNGGSVMAYFDSQMFQEINYQVGAISAENAQGGVVMNMVTKTGTNDFHGLFNFSGSNPGLQSTNVGSLRDDLLAGVPAKAKAANPNLEPGNKILSIFDSSATVSGPIVRNKLWFVATGRLQSLNQLQVGSYNPDGTQFVDDNRIKNGSFKLSWQVTTRNQIHYTFSRNKKFRYHRNDMFAGASFWESRATVVQAQPANIHQLKWTSTIGPRIVLDVGSSLQEGPTPYTPQKDVQKGDIPRLDLVSLVGSVAVPVYSIRPQYKGVLNAGLSYLVGKHDLKFGYQFGRSKDRRVGFSMSHYPAGLVARYSNGVPNSVLEYNSPYDYSAYFVDHAWYVQDKWAITRKLTLNLGLRLQKTNGWVPPVCQKQTIFVNAQCFDKIPNVPDWFDLAPRFAIVYDVFGNGKTAVKVAANRYDIGIGSDHQFRVNPVNQVSQQCAWSDRNGDLLPGLDELSACTGFNFGSTNRYNPNLKRPYSNEFSFEVEHQLPGNIVVSAGVFHRETRRNIGSMNLAVPKESYVPLTVKESVSGQTVTVYNQSPALRGKFDTLWDNFGTLDSNFNGVDINFRKRMSNQWMVIGGFSYGHNHGDTAALSDLNNPNNFFRRGVLGNDVPHSFKVAPVYEAPLGFKVSANLQHFTGFPENTTVNVTSTTVSLTQGSTSIRVQPRGTSRLPDNTILDMRFSKTVRIGEDLKVDPALDIFNLTNSNSIQDRVTQMGPTFTRANGILRGRMFRLGFQMQF
jgi:hypothetical protein